MQFIFQVLESDKPCLRQYQKCIRHCSAMCVCVTLPFDVVFDVSIIVLK